MGMPLKSSPPPQPVHLNPNISLVLGKSVEELLKSTTLLWHKSTPCHATGHLHLLHLTYPLDPEDGGKQIPLKWQQPCTNQQDANIHQQ
jgi:hypothetical protein